MSVTSGWMRLFADEVCRVPVLLVADVLLQLDVGCQRGVLRSRPRFPKRTLIVERDLDLEMPEVGTPHALGDVQLVAVRLAVEIQPAAIVKSDRVDDERVAVPGADRVTEPVRTDRRWMRPPVEQHL